jgi:NADPH:quinone reductase-like Zn-dependent oxidoreductase
MKAVVLHEYGGPEKLQYEEMPDPVAGDGEVLVRLAASSVNPIDFKLRSGAYQKFRPLQFPVVLGRDVAGTVRSVGAHVTGFAPGDRAMALSNATYAELVVVKAADLARVPEKLDLVEAAALPLVTLTGAQLILRAVKIEKGQTVLVTGAVGGVGRTAVYAAKKAGAVVFAGVRKSQLKQAAELGADEVIALDDEEAVAKLGLIDAVADTVGGETGAGLMAKVKPGGVFGSVVGPPANAKMNPTVRVAATQVTPDAAMLRTLAEDVAAGRFKIPIDRMVPLADAAEAQAAAEKGGIGKVLLLG